MNQTSNFSLNQWDAEDRILREDFNADNEKIDAALDAQQTALADLTAQLANAGNCKIVCGSYKGNGKSGSANPNKLTFSGKPVFVAVAQSAKVGDSPMFPLLAVRSAAFAYVYADIPDSVNTLTWGNTSLNWYNTTTPSYQLNSSNTTYYYIALLAADE